MIKLLGVISAGGVPIKIKASKKVEGKLYLAAMVEAVKGLSSIMGSGEVRMLEFQDGKLIVTESEKGYTVVALVDRAEEYVKTLIKIIAEELDESDIAPSRGLVGDNLRRTIDQIIETYIEDEIDVSLTNTLASVWNPIIGAIKGNEQLARAIEEADSIMSEEVDWEREWGRFKEKVKGTLRDALNYALAGDFDHACAVSIDLEDKLAKIFAIRMGLLALSMTRTIAPPIEELKRIAETLPEGDPFTELIRASVRFVRREITSRDYLEVFRRAAEHFEFLDDEEHLLLSFLFLDTRVIAIPDFAEKLADFFRRKSEVICSYISAIVDRANIFEKLYSITSYDEFKDDLGVWKGRISGILEEIDRVVRPGFLRRLLRRVPMGVEANKLGITGSLNLQTYMALLTALAESPVLTLSERKEVLSEVLRVYSEYFRRLLRSNIPLFSYTVDSVFQSVGVSMSEFFHMLPEGARKRHVGRMVEFLRDILRVLGEEWLRRHSDTSTLFVVTNAICPALTMAGELRDEEVQLIYMALNRIDTEAIDGMKNLSPRGFATNLGNIMNTLASLASKTLVGENRTVVLRECVDRVMDVHKWFLSQGVVCRDDIASATFHASLAADSMKEGELERILKVSVALNRIAVPGMESHYDVAIVGEPLIGLLVKAWDKLGEEKYLATAKKILESSIGAWRKYGFDDKAIELETRYGQLLA